MKYLIEPLKKYPLLSDVQGNAKEIVIDVLENISLNILYGHMGVKPDKSFLFYGPPGTGKTFITKVINNEANKGVSKEDKSNIKMFDLITMKYDIGNYGTAYINQGSRIIQGFFDAAFDFEAKGQKVFLIFDEADVLFQSRTSGRHGHNEDTKNLETLMKNMQEAYDSDSIYLALITNLNKELDSASIRSGRIDKKIRFELPTLEERVKSFDYEIGKVNEKADYKAIRNYNSEKLGKLTKDLNYADIKNIVHTGVKLRIKELLKDSKGIRVPYATQKYLNKATKIINLEKESQRIGFNM